MYIWIVNLIMKIKYPIKDQVWPSRRWNLNRSDYIDLSGY